MKVSSAKPYVGDGSFLKTISFNFSENLGQRLENMVFLELLRKGYDIYYHLGKKECDFVIKEGLRVSKAIQVCADVSNPVTKKRELEGLKDAMQCYKLTDGLLLTIEQEEQIDNIIIMPVWKWLLEKGL